MRGKTKIALTKMLATASLLTGCIDDSDTPAGDDDTLPPDLEYSYAIVDTNQTVHYDNKDPIQSPSPGEAFYGQDAQFQGAQPNYVVSGDGSTVYDVVTGLTWVRTSDVDGDGLLQSPHDKLTWARAQAYPEELNAVQFGGYDDWRLPTLKELYSLILFSGEDVNPMGNAGAVPFIDTNTFTFAYGNTTSERIIDSQWASSTAYGSNGPRGSQQIFGVNFADGRIKAYGTVGPDGSDKTFFVRLCRGNASYGINAFVDHGDGTISDTATGLMWSRDDSGIDVPDGMNWSDSLAWVQTKNAAQYLGHDDWRLPNAKELQSIVDYERSPDTTGSAAIDAIFNATSITNEAGNTDYAYYWTGTTHVSSLTGGGGAAYVAFGRSLGYMRSVWTDVHGAGSQRSDPKQGDPAAYPTGHGPQGDAIRIFNFVRLVR